MLKHLFSDCFLNFSQCFYLLWFSLLVKDFPDRINVLRQFFFFFWCHLFVLIITPNFSVSSFVLTKVTCSRQNPVNYVKETSATSKNESVEGQNFAKNSKPVVNKTEIEEPVPHAPEGLAHVSPQLAELCESVYGEPVRLIHWQMKDNNGEQQFSTLFRECRRGWYFQMLLTQKEGKWSSSHRVLPSFLNLLEPDENAWAELTESATAKDWYALDEFFLNTVIFPNSRVIFAGSDLVGEEVADEAFKNFGFYVPDEDLLPVLLFEDPNLGVILISYFRHPDGFARENMVSDRNTDECEVYESLTEAQQRLDQKLSYYLSEA